MDESGEKVMLLPLVQVIRKSEHGKVLTPFVVYLGAFTARISSIKQHIFYNVLTIRCKIHDRYAYKPCTISVAGLQLVTYFDWPNLNKSPTHISSPAQVGCHD